ncbi:hypothetical protein H5087_13415 [Pseudoalteromonas sp. SR43-7]|uniref:hypothetical protein n=1 Tax=Pseudoalteromonas sp. SR43-7 TaxID=2760939 RepID=UPI0015FC8C58|nr:hypothetical protein [Pseudoalteromonas sp. SR43-7]MBB1330352.1 hypothetical protein [Pseudoalteromonas sp. SR43-7]
MKEPIVIGKFSISDPKFKFISSGIIEDFNQAPQIEGKQLESIKVVCSSHTPPHLFTAYLNKNLEPSAGGFYYITCNDEDCGNAENFSIKDIC